MDMRFGLLFHFLLGGSWTFDAIELESTAVETSGSDAPDSEIELVFFNPLTQRNQSRIVRTSASLPSRGGRTGLPGQAGVLGRRRGSTQPVPAIIAEFRPAVPTPTPAVETSHENNQAAVTRSQLVGQKRRAVDGGASPNESADQSRVAQTSASPLSRGGRIGSPWQACICGRGRGSTQSIPAISTEVRPAVPTPTPAIETFAESNQAIVTRSQLVGQKQPAFEGSHFPNESTEARPRVESIGASSRLQYTIPPIGRGLLFPINDVPYPPQNLESLLHNLEFALAFGQALGPIRDRQYQIYQDMGRNLDALQVTSAQVPGHLTCFLDQVTVNFAAINNQLEETRKRLEATERARTKAVEEKAAADRARIAAEEEAATKVESLQAEHQTALAALKLEYDTALTEERSRFSEFARRLQEVEVSLAVGQARQEAMANELEAVDGELMNEADYHGQRYRRSAIFLIKERYQNLDLNGIDFESLRGADDGEPSGEVQEAETMVVLYDEDAAESATDSTQSVAEEGPTEWAGGEEGDAIVGVQGGLRNCGG